MKGFIPRNLSEFQPFTSREILFNTASVGKTLAWFLSWWVTFVVSLFLMTYLRPDVIWRGRPNPVIPFRLVLKNMQILPFILKMEWISYLTSQFLKKHDIHPICVYAQNFVTKLGKLERLCHYTKLCHYSDVIMGTMASQITSLTLVYSAVYSGAD